MSDAHEDFDAAKVLAEKVAHLLQSERADLAEGVTALVIVLSTALGYLRACNPEAGAEALKVAIATIEEQSSRVGYELATELH